MKQLMITGLFVCSLLGGSSLASAQDASPKGGNRSSGQSPHWQTIGDITVLRVWQIDGADKYPQVSILRLKTEDFHEFTHDPLKLRKFVNENKVFSKAVIAVGPCVALSAVDETSDAAGWILTLVHTAHSRMTLSALPANPDLKPYFQPEK